MERFTNENQIVELVHSFETSTISRDAWRHAEHLTVALHYLSIHELDTATEKMRSGIFELLKAFGVDTKKEMPYHETLTVFWMRTVKDFAERKAGWTLTEKANELVATFDKDYPLNFYSRDLLFSDDARARFIDGDICSTTRIQNITSLS
ncbi:MAG: hypothetical protein ABJA02_15355 [Acidobacteriota bacterium]